MHLQPSNPVKPSQWRERHALDRFRAVPAAPHCLQLTASADDVDQNGHINNIAYLRWVQDAAFSHSRAAGFDLDRYRQLGGVFVVRKHELHYLQPTFAGDLLEAWTWVERWRAASCIRKTKIVRPQDRVTVAEATTLWALVDSEQGRPMRVPQQIATAFAPLGSDPSFEGSAPLRT